MLSFNVAMMEDRAENFSSSNISSNVASLVEHKAKAVAALHG